MNNIHCAQVKFYHAIKRQEFNRACENWTLDSSKPYPYPHYMFMHNLRERTTGFVAWNDKRALIRPTKEQALSAFAGLAE